jgi:hypothetical protein
MGVSHVSCIVAVVDGQPHTKPNPTVLQIECIRLMLCMVDRYVVVVVVVVVVDEFIISQFMNLHVPCQPGKVQKLTHYVRLPQLSSAHVVGAQSNSRVACMHDATDRHVVSLLLLIDRDHMTRAKCLSTCVWGGCAAVVQP